VLHVAILCGSMNVAKYLILKYTAMALAWGSA
jgi:hypothetical protein